MWFFHNRHRYRLFVSSLFCNPTFLLRRNYTTNKHVTGVSMSLTNATTFECPYCMTINDLEVDEMFDIDQTQIVDCQICCQPIVVTVSKVDGELSVQADVENE